MSTTGIVNYSGGGGGAYWHDNFLYGYNPA